MLQFAIIIALFVLAISGMALALHFSKYKKNDSGCCGGGHCSTPGNDSHSCYGSKIKYIDEKVLKS